MSELKQKDDLLIAVALSEFSVHYEQADPELSKLAWQLAADRLTRYDLEPREAVNELSIGELNRA